MAMPMMTRLSPKKRPLGKSGISVSPLAWGMWRFQGDDVKAAQALVEAALAADITLFDTADIYGLYGSDKDGFGAAEGLLGRVLAATPALRDAMVLATKGGIVPGLPYDSSPAYLAEALDASLTRLRVGQVDLWQIHRPDLLAHPQETARALEKMVASGKVRAIGVSNHTPAQVAALATFLTVPLVSTQPEFSPLHLDPIWDGTLDQAMAQDLAVLAWSPLGGGRLGSATGDVQALLAAQGARFGVSAAAATYSWLLTHPARPIPIIGSQRAERIAEAADAFRVEWTRAEWYAVLQASMGESLP